MFEAIKEAKKAYLQNEVPIGCVIVKNGKVISRAYNKREKLKNSTAHAEILAIQKACKKLGDWRLTDCDLYVTVEPCPMCAGACFNSRLRKIVYGCNDYKGGSFGGVADIDMTNLNVLNHKLIVEKSPYADECKNLLTKFFNERR